MLGTHVPLEARATESNNHRPQRLEQNRVDGRDLVARCEHHQRPAEAIEADIEYRLTNNAVASCRSGRAITHGGRFTT